jgi:cell division inhibitor SepF
MDEMILQEKPGLFTRIANVFTRTDEMEEEEDAVEGRTSIRPSYRYTVTVRRQINCFEDAMAAATGLKRGEQQILNLASTEPTTRQKIVDFMCGVNFAQEGTWEEIGDNIYLIVPNHAYVEMAPPTPRVNALRN